MHENGKTSNSWTQAAILSESATLTRSERFERFHEANPAVYVALVESARSFRRQTGRDRCGMSLLFARVRWVLAVETDEGEPALNNDYLPFYSRLIMAREPDLSGMFDVRRSDADEWVAGYVGNTMTSTAA